MEEKHIPLVSVGAIALIVIVAFFLAGSAGDRPPAGRSVVF
jgi:hypothetical protein